MFDISWTEILVIVVVALITIGPKELPRVLYEIGKWVRQARMMAGEFQRHFNDMMHDAELEDLRRQAMAARDMMNPKTLAELADPNYTIRDSLDPTSLGSATAGSPPEEAESPAAAPPVAAAPVVAAPVAAVTGEGEPQHG